MVPVHLERGVEYLYPEGKAALVDGRTAAIEDLLRRIRPDDSGFLFVAHDFHKAGVYSCDGSFDEAIELWRSSLWFRRANLLLSSLDRGVAVELVVPGADAAMTFGGTATTLLRSSCVLDLFVAEVLGDYDLVRDLVGFHRFSNRHEKFLSLQVPRLALYRALFAGDDAGALRALDQAAAGVNVPGMPTDTAAYAQGRLVAEYGLVGAVLSADQGRFDAAVVAAHDAHVSWYSGLSDSHEPRNGSANVLMNWPLSGLVALGMRRGLQRPPQSPYAVPFSPPSTDAPPAVFAPRLTGEQVVMPAVQEYKQVIGPDGAVMAQTVEAPAAAVAVTLDAAVQEQLVEASFKIALAYCLPVLDRHFGEASLQELPLVEAGFRDQFAKVVEVAHADGLLELIVAEAEGYGGDYTERVRVRDVDGVRCEMGTTDYLIDILGLMSRRGEMALVDRIQAAAGEGRLQYVLVEVASLDDRAHLKVAVTPYEIAVANVAGMKW